MTKSPACFLADGMTLLNVGDGEQAGRGSVGGPSASTDERCIPRPNVGQLRHCSAGRQRVKESDNQILTDSLLLAGESWKRIS